MARILVLRNVSAEADELALLLEFAGHRCNTALSLQEAASLLRKESYDMVMADSTLGDSSSAEGIRKLKAISPWSLMVVLCASAKPAHGADEVLLVPLSPEYFFQRIHGLLQKHLLQSDRPRKDLPQISVRPGRTLRKIRSTPPGPSAKALQRTQHKLA